MRYASAPLATSGALQTPAPPAPAAPSFGEELAGRRLLLKAMDRLRSARGSAYRCVWTVAESGKVVAGGEETLFVGADRGRFDLRQTSGAGAARSVRRAVLVGDTLLAVRYDARPLRRDFVTVPAETVAGQWVEALGALGVAPVARAAALALGRAPLSGQVWRAADGSVLETPFGARRGAVGERIRRYRFAADGGLARFEEWTTTRGRGGRTQSAYRKEEYLPAPRPADLFSQSLAPGYTARPTPTLAGGRRPQPLMAPQARALLDRWQEVFVRPLSLQATVAVRIAPEPRTEVSRNFGRRIDAVDWQVWLRRPGRGRAQGERRGFEIVAVTDGERASGRRVNRVNDSENVWSALVSVGADDGRAQLDWFLDGPPRLTDYDSVAYVGRGILDDGTEVEVIAAIRSERRREPGGRSRETVQTLQIGFAADGFPRQFEMRRRTNIELINEADQPPDQVQTIAWRNLLLDREPAPDRFQVR